MSARESAGPSDDLFETIARLLDPSQRAYFYERMVYFRQLRPDDELLRLVEAIGFLAVIIRAAPEAVAVERAQLADTLATSLAALRAVAETTAAYHRELEARLSGLPVAIADGISPPVIAQAIAEHLRQQVVQTGLPVTAGALALTARDLNGVLSVAQQTVQQLLPWTHAATTARDTVEQVRATVTQTAREAEHTMTTLRRQFTADYRQALTLLCGAALVLGALLGVELQRWRDARGADGPPVTVVDPPAAIESSPPPRVPQARRRPSAPRPTAAPDRSDGSVLDHPWNTDGTPRHDAAPTP